MLKVVRKRLDELSLDPANARKHNERNLSAIKGSLARFGQQKPVVILESGVIIAGNGTYAAAKALGWDELDCVVTGLSGSTAIAFALADNKTAELAEWDDDILSKTLDALLNEGFEVEDIGFDVDDIPGLGGKAGLTDDDAVPEIPQNIHGVKLGDVWQLGNHRLMCGDSTVKENVEKLMAGEKADMVFTDPPYGMNLDTDYSKIKGSKKSDRPGLTNNKYSPVIGDNSEYDPGFLLSYFSYCKEIFLWGFDYYCQKIPAGGGALVWDKTGGHDSLMQAGFGSNFELCWTKQRHKRDICRHTYKAVAGMKPEDGKRVHPTQKPVGLAEWFFSNWSESNDLVADLFLGSGSTLIACEKTNRKCYGMELDPHYCSVIIQRWQDFTGKKAICEKR